MFGLPPLPEANSSVVELCSFEKANVWMKAICVIEMLKHLNVSNDMLIYFPYFLG